MKWTESFLFTLKEAPADAEITSHKLLVRGGLIKKLAPGIYSYGPLALRAIRKFENIIREELEKIGSIELLMPMVQPRELWEETDRWAQMGDGLQKLKNRNGQDFCLGATHEEVITDYVRKDLKSYRDLPVILFQIQTKFRDEIRPRFGLMRGREFIMKDAYSFDLDEASAHKTYDKMYQAYVKIFERLGVNFRVVQADTGNIGGSKSHEFQILAEAGEDQLLVSSQGDFAANIEVCPVQKIESIKIEESHLLDKEIFETPGIKTIDELATFTKIPQDQLVKTLFFDISDGVANSKIKPICVLIKGDDELNPFKLKNLLKLSNPPPMLIEEDVLKHSGAHPGSCGPIGLEMPVYLDQGVLNLKNYIVGANKDGFHFKNVNHNKDFKYEMSADLRFAKVGDLAPDGLGTLESFRGIEVGHVFYLGTKYSKSMMTNYLNKEGKSKPVEMGCYGIGVSRTVQAVIEQLHDKDGIMWPLSIAPFIVHICQLDFDDNSQKATENIYQSLLNSKIDVLLDDRNERPGVKFKDADLLGMPLRVVVGARGLKEGHIEIIERKDKVNHKVLISKAFDFIKTWVEQNDK